MSKNIQLNTKTIQIQFFRGPSKMKNYCTMRYTKFQTTGMYVTSKIVSQCKTAYSLVNIEDNHPVKHLGQVFFSIYYQRDNMPKIVRCKQLALKKVVFLLIYDNTHYQQ